jgi:hypothetical protein
VLFSYIKYEARNCMYGKRGSLPSRNFGGLAKRGPFKLSLFPAATILMLVAALIDDRKR